MKKTYIETYNCLLDSVFEPDMTDRQQPKTMQQRLRDEVEEERWWDEPITRYDDWFIPEGDC